MEATRDCSRKPTRRVATAVALAAGAALALSACGSGQISQTAIQVAASTATAPRSDDIALRNVHVIYPNSEEYSIEPGGTAVLGFTIVNDDTETPDKLTEHHHRVRGSVRRMREEIEIAPQTSLDRR